jgi:membrane associated rhomboid family serine protease
LIPIGTQAAELRRDIDESVPILQRELVSEPLAIANAAIILVTVLVSLGAFNKPAWVEKLIFEPRAILVFKEYYRMATSALLHADGSHLFGNMLTLYFFGSSLELYHGPAVLVFIYLASIIGGSALSLWLHRHHDYRALGASGGVCGVLFAWILFFPGGTVAFLFVPIPIPGWLYAIAYLVFSFVGMRRGWGNIGHDAHLGGALIGVLLAAAINPHSVSQSPWLFGAILVLGGLIFLYLFKNPLMLPLRQFRSEDSPKPPKVVQSDSRPSEEEVNAILDKVTRSGMQSLNAKERKTLEAASQRRS